MNRIHSSSPDALGRADVVNQDPRAIRAEGLQRDGKKMVIAGFVITILGVVMYCAVNFAGEMTDGMNGLAFRNVVPFTWGTLAVLGLGTLIWLVGSFTYLRGMMDADVDSTEEREP
ncbi:MAG: hypothetical protein HUU21_11140 [Polyangiaceae bacterium]|nr:hypothetical protein [Polyangiaceae bacterium]